MNVNCDIMMLILSKMDNEAIFRLTSLPDIWLIVREVINTSEFWRLRIVQQLATKQLVMCYTTHLVATLPEWKGAYYILQKKISLTNSDDNSLVTTILISSGFDPAADDNLAVKKASRLGLTNILRVLLRTERVDIHSHNNYCLRKAIEGGHTDAVLLLK